MPLTVIYDGACSLCRRSVFLVRRMDWFGRCRFLDYHDSEAHACAMAGTSAKALDEALHVVVRGGRVMAGFKAVRRLLWVNPLGWLVAPVFYLPGAEFVGRALYERLARTRNRGPSPRL